MRILTVVVLLVTGTLASAQGLSTLGARSSGETAESAPLADAILRAAEQGVAVVVVDPEGQVIAVTGDPSQEPAEEVPMMASASILMKAQERAADFRSTLRERLEALPNSVNEVAFILRATSPDGRIMTYVEALVFSVLLFILARFLTTELYGKRFAKRFVVARIKEAPEGYAEKMPFLVFRFFMGVTGTLVSMLIAYTIGLLIFGSLDDVSLQFTILAIYSAYFFWAVISDVWRMILSPYLSQYRIPRFSDRDARRLYLWAISVALIDFTVVAISAWLADFGLNYNLYAIVYGVLSLGVLLLNILMILVNRRAITGAIRNDRSDAELPWVTRFITYAWAPAVIIYFIFGWLKLAVDLVLERPVSIPMIAGAYMVFLSVVVVYGIINYVIERYFERNRALREMNASATTHDEGEATEEEVYRPTAMMTYEALARRVSGILAFVAGSYAMLKIWDSDNVILNDIIIDRGLDVIVIIFIGYIIYHAIRIWIDGKIAEESGDMPEAELGDEGGGASSASRLATLLPLFRNFMLIIVVVSIALVVLLELGINVSPLFAGAGVVGLAVGFGAQTLVRDIFSGAFFLVDDAFRKGEYIDIGQVKGTVEKISVRSFQLRHHLGALHTIPFGEIQVLTNYSRDWVMMKLPLRVTYDTDVDRVRKLIKNLGAELMEDPVVGPSFLQPLKSQGVIEMQDSAMIIRVKFMTKPGDQWIVRKRVYQDIRDLFEREGIKFAHREVTVRIADEPEGGLTPKQREAVSGAVNAAIDEDAMDVNPGDGGDDR
ncbi:mechanosensitive ion channel family protein [Aestuariivita boseongensis]|uniref:mechanosensitive ion channel family protein n=1 Tax=Aestuariivita boseongensis TaxID=1470562 RepID=UPI001FDF755B|nr:mechanosensitive ion channel domain-containing protein [Aestuariivita boseongensis]